MWVFGGAEDGKIALGFSLNRVEAFLIFYWKKRKLPLLGSSASNKGVKDFWFRVLDIIHSILQCRTLAFSSTLKSVDA